MTEERFNVYQLKTIKQCFDLVEEKINARYRGKFTALPNTLPEDEAPNHWRVMKEAIDNFDLISQAILKNELEKIQEPQWMELMLLVETISRSCGRAEMKKAQALKRGLLLLVGMFRNQFPGEKWNPEEFRWTTVGDIGERGLSPMLMAIAEL